MCLQIIIKKIIEIARVVDFFYFVFDRRACIFYAQSHIIYITIKVYIYRVPYQKNNNSLHVWNFKVGRRIQYIDIILCIIWLVVSRNISVNFVRAELNDWKRTERVDIRRFFASAHVYRMPSPPVVTTEWQSLVVDYVSSDEFVFFFFFSFCPQTDTTNTK